MAERLTKAERSQQMARVRSSDTKPELTLRSALHRLGFRFRLHRKNLPGTPDIVMPGRMTAIFVNGCFWHRHEGCKRATLPSTRSEFWSAKLQKNVERDALATEQLERLGYRVLVFWECEIRRKEQVQSLILERLGVPSDGAAISHCGPGDTAASLDRSSDAVRDPAA